VIDHVSREIRLKRMKRRLAIEIVKKYIYKKPENLHLFLNWVGITENSFYYLIDQHRNKEIWQRNEKWDWELKDGLIYNNINEQFTDHQLELLQIDEFKKFIITDKKSSPDKTNEYIIIGKGK
jgi:hypothetical protein